MATALCGVAEEVRAQASDACSLSRWADDIFTAWMSRATIPNAGCYRGVVTSMDTARELRDEVVARFDEIFPRVGYKVVGLDPVNAALPGVDRPMVGMMYATMFQADGTILPIESAELMITEPDLVFRVSDAGVNDASTLEEVVQHLDRVYAFIETPAPTFVNNPPNAYLLQASNLMPRWGALGGSVEVESTAAFVRSLESMTVTFRDGDGVILAEESGSYLSGNPLNAVLVVAEELRRRGERLEPGDLVSAGSYMPPILVDGPADYEAIYEGLAGQTIRVSVSFR